MSNADGIVGGSKAAQPNRMGIVAVLLFLGTLGATIFWLCREKPSQICKETLPESQPALKGQQGEWFRDVTAHSGIQFSYRNGEEQNQFALLESLGGGVALLDYDRDGLLDILVTGGGYFAGPDKNQIKGYPCKLYRNRGAWKFQDVTEATGLNIVGWWYTHGAAVADYDCDGWPDLLVTGYGKLGALSQRIGREGGRRFVEVEGKARSKGPFLEYQRRLG